MSKPARKPELQTNTPTLPKRKYVMFVGLDVHKSSVQVAAVDETGKLLFNKKISSDFSAISKITAKIPKNTKYV